MKVYLGARGAIDTRDAALTIMPRDIVSYLDGAAQITETEQTAVSYKGGPSVIYPRIYKEAGGCVAEMRGDMETAARYALSVDDLRRMDWKEVTTSKKPILTAVDYVAAARRAAQLAEDAERERYQRKHGKEGVQYIHSYKPDYNDAKSLCSRISRRAIEAGYILQERDFDWPNPSFRVLCQSTGDWPDDGPLSKNGGVFSLYQLANYFGDPCADDLCRRYVDATTGEVVGANE